MTLMTLSNIVLTAMALLFFSVPAVAIYLLALDVYRAARQARYWRCRYWFGRLVWWARFGRQRASMFCPVNQADVIYEQQAQLALKLGFEMSAQEIGDAHRGQIRSQRMPPVPSGERVWR